MTLIVRGSVVGAGIDYITLTETRDVGETSTLDMIYQSVGPHDSPRQAKRGGYKGYVDGKFWTGKRERDGKVDRILQISGRDANCVHLFTLDDIDRVNCTRLDIQVTVMMRERDVELGRRYFDLLKYDGSYRRAMVGRRKINLIDGRDGQTLYIGSRTSKTFLFRMYDKAKDYKGETGWYWRFEFELKRELAKPALKAIMGSEVGDITAAEAVAYKCEMDCGILLPVGVRGDPTGGDKEGATQGTALDWLKRCVKPVVSRETIAGNTEQVIKALGLDWLVEMGLVRVIKVDESRAVSEQKLDNSHGQG